LLSQSTILPIMANNAASNAAINPVKIVMPNKYGRKPCVQLHANVQKFLDGVVMSVSGKGEARF